MRLSGEPRVERREKRRSVCRNLLQCAVSSLSLHVSSGFNTRTHARSVTFPRGSGRPIHCIDFEGDPSGCREMTLAQMDLSFNAQRHADVCPCMRMCPCMSASVDGFVVRGHISSWQVTIALKRGPLFKWSQHHLNRHMWHLTLRWVPARACVSACAIKTTTIDVNDLLLQTQQERLCAPSQMEFFSWLGAQKVKNYPQKLASCQQLASFLSTLRWTNKKNITYGKGRFGHHPP